MTTTTESQRKEIDRLFSDFEAARKDAERAHAERRTPHPAPIPTVSAADQYADTIEARATVARVVDTYRSAAGLEARTWTI